MADVNEPEETRSKISPSLGTWGTIAGNTRWLRWRTPFQGAPNIPMSLTGAGVQSRTTLPSQILPHLSRTIRQSGTSVDGDPNDFETLLVSPTQFQAMQSPPLTYTDGGKLEGKRDYAPSKSPEPVRDTMDNLCEEMERQRSVTKRLQKRVDIQQELIDRLMLQSKQEYLQLDNKITQQQLVSQKLMEKSSRDSAVLDFSLLNISMVIYRRLAALYPIELILSIVKKENLKAGLNKSLQFMVSMLIFVLLTFWVRLFGLGELMNKVETFVYKLGTRLFLPFRDRMGKKCVRSTEDNDPWREKTNSYKDVVMAVAEL